ncbi:ribosomal protein S5 domain 2-type protein [Mucidula mucida]|nr:ribosomal protein S5 domain 2-type protein [Mucidula mucida]
MTTLDSFITRSRALPVPIATSQEIRDRGSTFVGTIFRCSTVEQARVCIQHLRNVIHGNKPASHEIAAWRCMAEDDGEQWAGERVLKVMKAEAVIDAVLVVSRWYGGTMLGPVRFTHIETCATEVCHAFKQQEELDEAVLMLSALDEELSSLRSQLNALNEGGAASSTPKPPTYPEWTVAELAKAKRLVKARENAIRSVKSLIEEKRQ